MLQQILTPQITEIEQQSGQLVICTQDGAPPRHLLAVRNPLNNRFINA